MQEKTVIATAVVASGDSGRMITWLPGSMSVREATRIVSVQRAHVQTRVHFLRQEPKTVHVFLISEPGDFRTVCAHARTVTKNLRRSGISVQENFGSMVSLKDLCIH